MKQNDSLIKQENRNAKYLKETLAYHLFWHLKYTIVCDEFKFMDLFGVRRNGYQVEFEIKVNKSDFDREIRCIIASECEHYGKDWEKYSKHKIYLTGERPKTSYDLRLESFGISDKKTPFRPNEFYFYVPDYLADYAVLKVTKLALPYGVVKIGKKDIPSGRDYFWPYTMVKKATKLHSEKADQSIYYALAHALTIRNKLLN